MPKHQPPANSQERFSNRVADYVRYRPSYPLGVIELLTEITGLRPGSKVADIGSGTGISSAMLLEAGCEVFAVEPNAEMRQAAEIQLGSNPRFHSIAAPAEVTTLADHSMDLVTAAQAFHWFDLKRTRVEFSRILAQDGFIALIWNVRQTGSTPFLRDYEELLRTYATDYAQVRHENVDDPALRNFFCGDSYQRHILPNAQHFDFEGLSGRLLSSSYAPAAGHPLHLPMMEQLRRLFDVHQQKGIVDILYDTEIHVGK